MSDLLPRLTVEVFPAAHGDAILVRYVTDGGAVNILIDAGLAETYRVHIKPRLQELHAAGESLSAFIVTHIDADHIEGAIAFLLENGDAAMPTVISVDDVWHNSYRHLRLTGRTPTPGEVNRVRSQTTFPAPPSDGNISAKQGTTLAALLNRHRYPWNRAFAGGPILSSSPLAPIVLGHDLRLTVLSPGLPNLEALSRRWRQELLKMGVARDAVSQEEFESAYEARLLRSLDDDNAIERTQISGTLVLDPPPASAFREDRSVSNGSSIAVSLHAGPFSALLLGDALPSVVSSALEQLRANTTGLNFGFVKVSHHGSKRNTSPDFLSAFRADNFIISTNGAQHSHPDMEALLWIISTQRGAHLHFNYPTPRAEAIDSVEMRKRFGHSVSIGTGSTALTLTLTGAT